MLPSIVLMIYLAMVLRDVARLPGGLTGGERVVLRNNLLGLVAAAALFAVALVAIRRADRDRRWRVVAWASSAVVLAVLLERTL